MNKERTVQEQLEAIRLEKELLELEEQRDRVAQLKAKKEAARLASEQQEASIKASMEAQKREQSYCSHRQGGMDMQGLLNGNSENYSVIKHQLSNMEILVMCTRCAKQWKAGDEGYNVALTFPTNNQMSGSVTFANTHRN